MTPSHLALVVEDDQRHAALYESVLRGVGFEVRLAPTAEAALLLIGEYPFDLVVSDVKMPGSDGLSLLREVKAVKAEMPFLLVTAFPNVRDAVAALKLGAVDYLEKPVDLDELGAAALDAVGSSLTSEGTAFSPLKRDALSAVIAESPLTRKVFEDALLASPSCSTILVTGESGTGKEVLARFIHENSPRAGRNYVAVNCGAIPANLIASELFGHEKGAFTGAQAKRSGRFREADGGTLFLDEIGELPLDLQPVLLRVIETGMVTPVGADREESSDFRLIAATNKNLAAAVESGRFRSDLFYRLNVIAFEMPPLRRRPEDIIPLCRHFMTSRRKQFGSKRLSPAAARMLRSHNWPGNVRELFNILERAMVLSKSDAILPEHLPPHLRQCVDTVSSDDDRKPTAIEVDSDVVKTLEQAEFDTIRDALAKTGGNRTKAADLLGISRRSLLYKLRLMRNNTL